MMETKQTETPAVATVARKKRRWYRPTVALLGFVVLLLAAIGVVSLVMLGVNSYHASREKQREDLTYFISPLTYYTPAPFDTPDDSRQDALILSALYKITEAERIRQLQEGDMEYTYPLDEYSRLAIPLAEVDKAYASLYGADAKPWYHTIGTAEMPYTAYEYNAADKVYYVPVDASESLYNVFVDTISVKGDQYTLTVCYVPESNIRVDDRGNELPPTRKEAQYVQIFTLRHTDTGWQILAVAEESAATTASTGSTDGTASTARATKKTTAGTETAAATASGTGSTTASGTTVSGTTGSSASASAGSSTAAGTTTGTAAVG